jgi:hypothetical protein
MRTNLPARNARPLGPRESGTVMLLALFVAPLACTYVIVVRLARRRVRDH